MKKRWSMLPQYSVRRTVYTESIVLYLRTSMASIPWRVGPLGPVIWAPLLTSREGHLSNLACASIYHTTNLPWADIFIAELP